MLEWDASNVYTIKWRAMMNQQIEKKNISNTNNSKIHNEKIHIVLENYFNNKYTVTEMYLRRKWAYRYAVVTQSSTVHTSAVLATAVRVNEN